MKNIVITLIAFIQIFSLISCKSEKKESEVEVKQPEYYVTLTDAQIKAGDIKLDSVKEYPFEGMIEVAGNIEVPPASMVEITSLLSGRIKGINLIEGQNVQKGQYLFSIENPELISMQQEFASIGEQLSYLKNDYERQLKLYNENVNSEKKYLQAESLYKSSLANYTGLKKKLQLLGINTDEVQKGNFYGSISVHAPISGSISGISKANGSYINTSESILDIVNTKEAHLTMQVFENDVPYVKINQPVTFTTPDGTNHKAKVHLISSALNMDTKTILVHADILDNVRFYNDMFVNATIITQTQTKKGIPVDAVLNEGDTSFILVLDKSEKGQYFFNKFPIKITQKNENYVTFSEIDNLKDKLIITEGVNMLQKEE